MAAMSVTGSRKSCLARQAAMAGQSFAFEDAADDQLPMPERATIRSWILWGAAGFVALASLATFAIS